MVRGGIVGPRATEARRTETHIQKMTEEEKIEIERGIKGDISRLIQL